MRHGINWDSERVLTCEYFVPHLLRAYDRNIKIQSIHGTLQIYLWKRNLGGSVQELELAS
jgi:hypothetical protein